jgi:hypothetical protein
LSAVFGFAGIGAAEQVVECDLLIVGGGMAGTAAAREALLAGRTVCLTEITDWVGGQVSSQGTSALDEGAKQRSQLFFARGYQELRSRLEALYGQLNPGDCWVSVSCFLPRDAHTILTTMLAEAARTGGGTLRWFPHTVVKDLAFSGDRRLITSVQGIQHRAVPGMPSPATYPLSVLLAEAYDPQDSPRFQKQLWRFRPRGDRWIVIDSTETGELVALADVPYRLGLDPRSHRNPSSPSATGDPYCTQGFTYTFAFEQTATPQPQEQPPFYSRYAPYYGYDPNPRLADFDVVFTYRRIWSPEPRRTERVFGVSRPKPGDISMQNWVWGNDYRPGTSRDNLILTRQQLQQRGELQPGGWRGGLRQETLRSGEELALGFYYWLVAGTTNSQVGEKKPHPNHRLLRGLDSPMGTGHGLSKYPYIREARRIVGRPSWGHRQGFSVDEVDISRVDYSDPYYRETLPPQMFRNLWRSLAGLELAQAIRSNQPPTEISRRTRSTIYPDAVGISHYQIDFHPCLKKYPVETPGNIERPEVRRAHAPSYPAQIPLRALIPQRVDNLLVAGKAIAVSYVAAAAYRVHSFEWSVGAAAGTVADQSLRDRRAPYDFVADLPRVSPQLLALQQRLVSAGNPIAFPDTSIFNLNWEAWRIW